MENAIQVQLEKAAFNALADLLEGKRDDIVTVATALGVTHDDLSMALIRSLGSRGKSLAFGQVISKMGIHAKELVAHASLFGPDLLSRLQQQAPELFPNENAEDEISVGAVAAIDPYATVSQPHPSPVKHDNEDFRGVFCRRYSVEKRLGKGGQAEVFRVFDIILHQPAAMKLFYSRSKSESETTRELDLAREEIPVTVPLEPSLESEIDQHILREVELFSGRAVRPGVLRLLDWGCIEERPFLIFPLCASDLAHRRREAGTIEPKQAVQWTIEAADALESLNRRGIVHADVKPHNLLLDQAGRIQVADLGLANLASDPEPEHFAGSPSYMSPEQLCIQPLNAQTDVFGLGVTLYELLAGRPPFKITKLSRDEIDTLRRRMLFEPFPPLPASVPEALNVICMKAMARDPVDRYRSLEEFAQALRSWQNPVLRRLMHRVAAWFRRKELPMPEKRARIKPEYWHPESLAESLRGGMLISAETGDWQQALEQIDLALIEHEKTDDAVGMIQFLWDACRVAERAKDRAKALLLGKLLLAHCRDFGSPMGAFISQLLEKWSRGR